MRQSPVSPALRFLIRTVANVAAAKTTVTLTFALKSYSAVSPDFSTHKFPLKGCWNILKKRQLNLLTPRLTLATSEQPFKSGHPLC